MSDDPGTVYSGPFPIHPSDTLFYAQAGACLMEWASIDSILFNICASALGVSDDIASVVYTRTPTMETRLALIADLLAQRFLTESGKHHHSLRLRMKDLVKSASDLSKVRNKIAHRGRLQVTHIYAGPQPPPEHAGPSFHSVVMPSSFKSGDGVDLDLAALRAHQKAVFALAMALRDFREALREALPG